MSEMGEAIFKSKKALPNKLMQEDGSITDMLGNPVTNSVVEYDSKTSLPNKWMNPDGSYSTLNEIIAGAIDTDLFIVVQELPATGEDNKIYLVPKDGGTGFVEWIYADGQWDTIGELEIDLSDYPTSEDMQQYVGSNTLTKTNTTEFIPTANYHPATKKYVDDKAAIQVFLWDGDTGSAAARERTKVVWQAIYDANQAATIVVCVPEPYSSRSQSSFSSSNMTTYASAVINKQQLNSNTLVQFSGNTRIHTANNSTINTYTTLMLYAFQLNLTISNGVVSGVTKYGETDPVTFLEPNRNYSAPYTPTYDGSPATKKYVDDAIATNVTNLLNGSY